MIKNSLPAKIQKLIAENPSISKAELVELLVEDKELRFKKEVIQNKVKEFISTLQKKQEPIDVEAIPEPKKKQKQQTQFLYEPQ